MVLNKRSLHQTSGSGLEPGTCIVSNRCDHRSTDCLKLFRTSFHVDEKLWCHTSVLYRPSTWRLFDLCEFDLGRVDCILNFLDSSLHKDRHQKVGYYKQICLPTCPAGQANSGTTCPITKSACLQLLSTLFWNMWSDTVLPLLLKFRNFWEFGGFSRIFKKKRIKKKKSGISSIIYNWYRKLEPLQNFRIFCDIPGIFRVYFRILIFEKWKH